MPISAFAPKSCHTFYYLRKQIANNISGGSPTFHCPTVGTQIVTFFGISHLFVSFDLPTTGDTSWDIPTFLPICSWYINKNIPWDIPTFSTPTFRDTFRYIPLFCQTNKRDTNYYIQPLKCKEPSLLSQIFILVYRKTL